MKDALTMLIDRWIEPLKCIFQILTDANFATIGSIVEKVQNDPDFLLELNGFGPKFALSSPKIQF